MLREALSRQRCVNVIVAHPDDDFAQQSLERMADLALAGAIEPMVASWDFDDGASPTASVIGESGRAADSLSEILAKVARLERVRVVGLHCPLSGVNLARPLSQAVRNVLKVVEEIKGHATEVVELRIQAATAAEPALSRQAFSGYARANVAIIPHDRLSDFSAARKIESKDSERLCSHIAVEVCSAVGAWSNMAESPFDKHQYSPPGGDGVPVVFFRSGVRTLVCPPLPIDKIVEAGSLPAPSGFFSSPVPSQTARAVAPRLFPEELRFVEGNEPSFRAEVGLSEALRLVPRRIFRVIRDLPRVFRDGVSRDLESLQGDGLQDLIGGEAAWLQINFRDRQAGQEAESWGDQALRSIGELERADDMPSLVQLPDEVWARLVSVPLAVSDGSEVAGDALTATGERRYLVSDPLMLAGDFIPDADGAVNGLLASLEPASLAVDSARQAEDVAVETHPTDRGEMIEDEAHSAGEAGSMGEAAGDTADEATSEVPGYFARTLGHESVEAEVDEEA